MPIVDCARTLDGRVTHTCCSSLTWPSSLHSFTRIPLTHSHYAHSHCNSLIDSHSLVLQFMAVEERETCVYHARFLTPGKCAESWYIRTITWTFNWALGLSHLDASVWPASAAVDHTRTVTRKLYWINWQHICTLPTAVCESRDLQLIPEQDWCVAMELY